MEQYPHTFEQLQAPHTPHPNISLYGSIVFALAALYAFVRHAHQHTLHYPPSLIASLFLVALVLVVVVRVISSGIASKQERARPHSGAEHAVVELRRSLGRLIP